MKSNLKIELFCNECKDKLEAQFFYFSENLIDVRIKPCKRCYGKLEAKLERFENEL